MGDRFFDNLEIGLSSYSKHSIDDYYEDGEETEGDYDEEELESAEKGLKLDELACPFCTEDFDVLGLCCHIDADHRMEVKPGICPVCATKVGINMASHVITQHESILKSLCNKKHFTTRSWSAILLLRKELQEKHLRSIKESPSLGSFSNVAADSMLLSFVHNSEHTYRPQTVVAASSNEFRPTRISSSDNSSESCRSAAKPSVETERNNERARKCEFVQGLMWSKILDDL